MNIKKSFSLMGPGIALAAAGVGMSDTVATSVAGAKFGFTLLWVLAFGAILKYFLSEGLIRWQIATGSTMIEAWNDLIGKWMLKAFLVYLVVWSIFVGGGLLSSVAVVTKVLVQNSIGTMTAGTLSATAILLVVFAQSKLGQGKSYHFFEKIMKFFIAVMFCGFIYAAARTLPDCKVLASGLLVPTIPQNSFFYIMGLIGSIGTSLTIMCYGYWAREKGMDTFENFQVVKFDLVLGYIFTGLFDICVLIVAVATARTINIKGTQGMLDMAHNLGDAIGPFGYWLFLFGFWAAVFSTLVSFFLAIPYLFCDIIATIKGYAPRERKKFVTMENRWFWGYSLYSAAVSVAMLQFDMPVMFVMIFSILGGIFMVFLSIVILHLNNRKDPMGKLRNSCISNIFLGLNVLLFIILLAKKIASLL